MTTRPCWRGRSPPAATSPAYFDAEAAPEYFGEAIGLARALDDRWRLSQILTAQTVAAAFIAGDPIATREPAEEGRDLADAIGNRFDSRRCRYWLGNRHSYIRVIWPEPPHSSARSPPRLRQLTMGSGRFNSLASQGIVLAYQGEAGAARAAADAAIQAAAEVGGVFVGIGYVALAAAALAAGDVATALNATAPSPHLSVLPQTAAILQTLEHTGCAGPPGSDRGPPRGR